MEVVDSIQATAPGQPVDSPSSTMRWLPTGDLVRQRVMQGVPAARQAVGARILRVAQVKQAGRPTVARAEMLPVVALADPAQAHPITPATRDRHREVEEVASFSQAQYAEAEAVRVATQPKHIPQET